MIPPLAWLAYIVPAVRPASRIDLLDGLVPLAAVAAVLVAPKSLADLACDRRGLGRIGAE
ncbi:hypothetical protein [Roseicyclus mahoneyensis]|uniref:hypothetical protein n=1 Tax=Roseicyclus mahoneyensis TaxID=164332 RepID=UPI000D6B1E6B|nr:hypothetical protein [Roseicyclus mahoneyensis]